jgi:DNA-binding XRE family transcriptional regulator
MYIVNRRCIQLNLNTIKTLDGQEYVLLPLQIYTDLKDEIDARIIKSHDDDYSPFILEDYIDNPVALARIKAQVTQEELANLMSVSQAYISKIESKDDVSLSVITKVNKALRNIGKT